MPIDNSSRFPKPLAADLQELSEGMAIVINGDTAPKAITSGQYLFIKNHSTLATGGYHATAAIASGADVTSSNVTPDADGIVNGAFSSLSEQIVPIALTVTVNTNYGTLVSNNSYKIGRLVVINLRISATASTPADNTNIVSDIPIPVHNNMTSGAVVRCNSAANLNVYANGEIVTTSNGGGWTSGTNYTINAVYVAEE